jgi:hypothetical protein
MKDGWTLPEIDGMDLCYFLWLMGRRKQDEEDGTPDVPISGHGNRGLYIDQFGQF